MPVSDTKNTASCSITTLCLCSWSTRQPHWPCILLS